MIFCAFEFLTVQPQKRGTSGDSKPWHLNTIQQFSGAVGFFGHFSVLDQRWSPKKLNFHQRFVLIQKPCCWWRLEEKKETTKTTPQGPTTWDLFENNINSQKPDFSFNPPSGDDLEISLAGGFIYFFVLTPIWGRFPFWLIFFKWVETTN